MPVALDARREAKVICNSLPQVLAAGRRGTDGVAKSPYKCLSLALELDRVMREQVPAGWKGDQARVA